MASLGALEREPGLAQGLFWFAGVNRGEGYDFGPHDVGALEVPALIVSTKLDNYLADEDARRLAGWWNEDGHLLLLPGEEHGTDVWKDGNERVARMLTARILNFLKQID
jgi:hypothetical protein